MEQESMLKEEPELDELLREELEPQEGERKGMAMALTKTKKGHFNRVIVFTPVVHFLFYWK